jgi:hypothetical protein
MCTRTASVGTAAMVWILSQYGSNNLMLLPPSNEERYEELWTPQDAGYVAMRFFAVDMLKAQADGERTLHGTKRGTQLKYEVLLPDQTPSSIAI